MIVKVVGRDLKINQDMIDRITYKLSFLDKYILIDDDTTAQVVVRKYGKDLKLEVTIPTKIGFLRSEVVNKELQDAVDLSIDKLEDQIRRQKTRLSRRHKDSLAENFLTLDVKDEEETTVRVKRIAVDDLDIDEAIMQMELVDHEFFVFRDIDSGVISILYKRDSGGYGVIEAV